MVNLGARGLLDWTVLPIIESGLYALGPDREHKQLTAQSKFNILTNEKQANQQTNEWTFEPYR